MFAILIALSIRAEIAKWYVAAAIREELNSNRIGALANLELAEKWDSRAKEFFFEYLDQWYLRLGQNDPTNPIIYAQRAGVRHFQRDLEAERNDVRTARRLTTEQLKAARSVDVGSNTDKEELKATAKVLKQAGSLLNSTAYMSALCDLDLDIAAKEIDESIRLDGESSNVLDTRGFIRLKRKEFASARSDLDQAVALAEAQLDAVTKALSNSPLSRIKRTQLEAQLRMMQSGLAVLVYHRWMALKDASIRR